MTLVAIGRINLWCRLFLAKMVMRSGQERTASYFGAEKMARRARMENTRNRFPLANALP